MKEELQNYIEMLSRDRDMQYKVFELHKIVKDTIGKEIKQIFISFHHENDKRKFDDLWFFTDHDHAIQITNFIENTKFNVIPLSERITSLRIKSSINISKDPYYGDLSIEFEVDSDKTFKLEAIEENGEKLKHILTEYLLTNLV